MSVPTFGRPAVTSEGDLYPVKDNDGHVLIVKPKGYNPSRPTKNTPEGAPCVVVDLVDLDDMSGTYVYRDVPLFGGALVDATKPALDTGEILLCRVRLVWNKTQSRQYPVLEGIDDNADNGGRAAAFYRAKGDPFAPQFTAPPQQQTVGQAAHQQAQGGYGQAPQQQYAPQPQQQYAPPAQQQPQYAPQPNPNGYGTQPGQQNNPDGGGYGQQPQYAPPAQQQTPPQQPENPWGQPMPQNPAGAPY